MKIQANSEEACKLEQFMSAMGYPGVLSSGYYQQNPLSCMPFPKFQHAMSEVAERIQVGHWLVIPAGLAALAVASQWSIKVRIPEALGNQVHPSLIIYCVALSGEGKTPVEDLLFEAVKAFHAEEKQCFKERNALYKHDMMLWDDKLQGLRSRRKKAVRYGHAVDKIEAELVAHLQVEPVKPIQIKLIYQDTTSSACFGGLNSGFPSAILKSTEGSIVTNSKLIREDGAKLCSLYSGETLTIDRANENSYELDAQLSLLIMTQPSKHEQMMLKIGEDIRGVGLPARGVVFDGPSFQDQRDPDKITVHTEHTRVFNARIAELLQEMRDGFYDPGFSPKDIGFTPEATRRLIEIKRIYQVATRKGEILEGAKDHVAKVIENLARLSALLHHFEGFSGDISVRTVNGVLPICLQSTLSFLSLFVPDPEVDANADAERLWPWLLGFKNQGIYRFINKPRIVRYGPNSMRTPKRVERALDVLLLKGLIALVPHGKGTGECVDLYPGIALNFMGTPTATLR
ncbi:MAG: DUF3987 domain-containing protein [Pseudomonadales bacterium]|nr:DUF3987 domain-containing protein [Pseudomonadales bacterium]